MNIPLPPLQSIVSITLYDEDGGSTVMNLDDFITDKDSEPARLAFKKNKIWPEIKLRSINSVKIRFIAGFTTVNLIPESVKTAIMLYVSHRFENPETDDVPAAFKDILWPDRIIPV